MIDSPAFLTRTGPQFGEKRLGVDSDASHRTFARNFQVARDHPRQVGVELLPYHDNAFHLVIRLLSPGRFSSNRCESRLARKSIARSKNHLQTQPQPRVLCRARAAPKDFGFVICCPLREMKSFSLTD